MFWTTPHPGGGDDRTPPPVQRQRSLNLGRGISTRFTGSPCFPTHHTRTTAQHREGMRHTSPGSAWPWAMLQSSWTNGGRGQGRMGWPQPLFRSLRPPQRLFVLAECSRGPWGVGPWPGGLRRVLALRDEVRDVVRHAVRRPEHEQRGEDVGPQADDLRLDVPVPSALRRHRVGLPHQQLLAILLGPGGAHTS